MAGWVKVHRSLMDWEWYGDHNTLILFIHILLRANHSDTQWRGQVLKRGQFLTSLDTLSRETGLSTSKIRTSLSKLVSTGSVASLSQARSRILTVLEYDSYQDNDKLDGKVIASKSQADDKLIATDKNVRIKECKKDLKDYVQTSFDEFYAAYPKKVSKKEATAKFAKLVAKAATESEIDEITNHLIADIQGKLSSGHWTDKQFIPNPAKYIHQELWNDENVGASHEASQRPNQHRQTRSERIQQQCESIIEAPTDQQAAYQSDSQDVGQHGLVIPHEVVKSGW